MKNLETLLTTKLDMIDIETKKNYENWIWSVRYMVVATLGILSKILFF
jgi:hypothetical protein